MECPDRGELIARMGTEGAGKAETIKIKKRKGSATYKKPSRWRLKSIQEQLNPARMKANVRRGDAGES
jgi:PHD/YefM family antitoxin component YafN of YafNO toxin-antitoxin module